MRPGQLARDWEAYDNLQWTLAPDVTWHDGQPTAADVEFTYTTLACPGFPGRAAGLDMLERAGDTVRFTLSAPGAACWACGSRGLPKHVFAGAGKTWPGIPPTGSLWGRGPCLRRMGGQPVCDPDA